MIDTPSESGFVPITPNPYIVGNPVRDRSMFFGREAEFEFVRKRFQESRRGGLLVFCGERRSGKTSILFQILDGRLGPAFLPVLIDMQSMAIENDVGFLSKITEEIQAKLDSGGVSITPPDYLSDSNPTRAFQRFMNDLFEAHPTKKPLLLFDEYELIEKKIESGIVNPDILHVFASLMETHPVFLVFTGSQHLEQRRRDYWKILGKSLYKRISFLDRKDAVRLMTEPVAGRVDYGEGTVDAIWRLTAGQPFYTQAVCQSLVDHLNEVRKRRATREMVEAVVENLANNPLPQMLFLWDGLGLDAKISLSLLAETLTDDKGYATADDVMRTLRRRKYPLDVAKPRIATALEDLFKNELLEKPADVQRGYAFRMDLWRRWVERMHSVWQVMREESLEVRRRRSRFSTRMGALLGVGALILVGAMLGMRLRWTEQSSPPPPEAVPGHASVAMVVEPGNAVVRLDGRPVAVGSYEGVLEAGDHTVDVSAPGYVDTNFAWAVVEDHPDSFVVCLRPQVGNLRIVTRPEDAEVVLDGQVRGRSPLTIEGLTVHNPHQVTVRKDGFASRGGEFEVSPETTVVVSLALAETMARVVVTTDPPGAAIRYTVGPGVRQAGNQPGRSPVAISLFPGRHTLYARLDGYVTTDTTLVVTENTSQVHLTLRKQPPGVLIVRGDRHAQIYIDGALFREGVQYSGPKELEPGLHTIRVILGSGERMEDSVEVNPNEEVIYDYSLRDVIARKSLGND